MDGRRVETDGLAGFHYTGPRLCYNQRNHVLGDYGMALSGIPTAWLIALAAAVVIIGVVVYMVKREARIKRMLLSRWGEQPEREISADELTFIRLQAEELAGEGFAVDDITWNDLDANKLYARANTALTDAGDHVLYAMLRNPSFDAAELERRRSLMAWAKGDPAGREKVKRLLYNLGRMGNIDIAALREGDKLGGKRRFVYIALSISLVLSIVLCLCGVWPAVIPLAALAVTNCVVSTRSRVLIGKYYSIYQFIPSVLSAARRVAEVHVPALEDASVRILERLGRIRGVLGNLMLNFYYSFNVEGSSNPVDLLMSAFNFFFLVDLISLYGLSRSVIKYRTEILDVYMELGEIDALIAAASWRETLPVRCEPALAAGEGCRISFDGLVHPLLREAVPNSLEIRRNILLTGSNATGKSTFLKAVALNAVLAQSLFTCTAQKWEGGFFRVYTSIALRDDLFSKESYFIAEIKSLKRMLDSLDGDFPALCVVDEVLRGTNTGERIAAAGEALRQFSGSRGLCLAATHDIELTHILENLYDNLHFTETVTDGAISFDYKLKPGRATSRNAIKLLGILGYGSELVASANARLEAFEKTGKWEPA